MMSSNMLLFMGIGGSEIILIVFAVLLLFGGKKIPELMKGVGVGIKSFKEGMNGVTGEAEAKVPVQKQISEDKN